MEENFHEENRRKSFYEIKIENLIFIILLILTFFWYGSMFVSLKIFFEKISQGKDFFYLEIEEIFFVLLSIVIFLFFVICVWQIKLLRVYFVKMAKLNISRGLNEDDSLEIYTFDKSGKKIKGSDYCFSGACYCYWLGVINLRIKIFRR
jgi:hypothetical protein